MGIHQHAPCGDRSPGAFFLFPNVHHSGPSLFIEMRKILFCLFQYQGCHPFYILQCKVFGSWNRPVCNDGQVPLRPVRKRFPAAAPIHPDTRDGGKLEPLHQHNVCIPNLPNGFQKHLCSCFSFSCFRTEKHNPGSGPAQSGRVLTLFLLRYSMDIVFQDRHPQAEAAEPGDHFFQERGLAYAGISRKPDKYRHPILRSGSWTGLPGFCADRKALRVFPVLQPGRA